MIDVNKFESMQIGLASPNKIRSWSHGEVKKPETINYRTLKPEKDGLFDERIFGPTKDYECACGKYKRIRYKGIVCDRCGVEVTTAKVRRERMGHIELAAPVSHIWYFKGIPSRMGLVLDMSPRSLEEIIYFASYVVTDAGDTPLVEKQLLSEREYREHKQQYGTGFKAGMGAEAIKALLANVDLEGEVTQLKAELREATGQKRIRAVRRLDIIEAFVKSGNKPEWMVMDVIPVIPPDLRPMVQLEGGRFATSDLNDLYRRVINRNNRLKRLLELNAPGIIVQNEKRMLQEAVDALVDNGRRGRPVTGPGNRPLKSLSHMLKGKQGRFRQNLLGKRVDYSGRSVIDVGPFLKMNQMGLPVPMAVELFRPFIMKELVEREMAGNIRAAKRKIDRRDDEVMDVLEDVIKEHPVLLNRAPTLHRLGIQAFEPVLVSGKAMRLHPLVTEAYNADFDGDQMAIHVPLSDEAQAEARLLMLAAGHILAPKDGKPIVAPSQDMVIGNYYLTTEEAGREGEGMIFKDINEARTALQNGYVHWHTRVGVQTSSFPADKPFTDEQRSRIMVTSVGKLLFNDILPTDFPYLNEPTEANLKGIDDRFFLEPGTDVKAYLADTTILPPFKKGYLSDIIAEVYKIYKVTETSLLLDRMKDLGYADSTKSGLTVGVADVTELKEKPAIIEAAHEKVATVTKQFRRGLITDDERYERVIEIWNRAKDDITEKLIAHFEVDNNIFMMSDSGARGNISNFSQLAGMRGLMAAPNGQIMELPIIANFREGLSVLEMFFSTHGARKGMTDTALKTADSGYMTRRLVDVAQDVIIREHDCGTDRGLDVAAIMNGNEVIEPLYDRILGRFAQKTVVHPETGEVIVAHNQMIEEAEAKAIIEAGITSVNIRSAFTCNTEHGVCVLDYGRNMATGDIVEVGEAAGTIAAQSIGEPGTQLTMRTFHTGGVAGNDITQGLPRVQEIFEARNPKGRAMITEVTGEVKSIEENPAERTKEVTIEGETDTRTYTLPMAARMRVAEGDMIHRGETLNEGSADPKEMIEVRDTLATENYLVDQVQMVYRMQGVEISDKHIEVMARQMIRKVRVMDPGETDLLPGTLMDIAEFRTANEKPLIEGKLPATARPVLLGITKASLETNSFLSAASFQETTRVLTDAAIRGKNDPLVGLKENVIIGKLIPAGTGMKQYQAVQPEVVGAPVVNNEDATKVPSIADIENTMNLEQEVID
ncbi:DNA-directed RNA polymerase subunit beta' [Weissella tructae]|uniref:DNA-directed RNA polymerase subunit beta' n=2 Tax=Weissella TaxID=46255 RepID=A0A075U0N0_9LACO|nr:MULTISPECIES: DNA-directed RNA polymerase subunit beta' [Weissella]AIG66061.1 DNA-directed RNA polymerase subunit beta' [Weissella tructae]AIM63440.1 DNA-directed RNA polymerase subunit beta' [Weissella ceti]AIM64775.1 DNA-directed RNA polymerase subunit beta' [Weissella ceti]ELA07432.1 DNA-directed RNA polymerase subunit beta' [Weissella ceti NC36]QVV91213.1 DNA-directed RNA polymerase subunit beta' [Weissella tructae]